MIRFPGASHGFVRGGRPSHRKFRLEEMTAWFQRWLECEPEVRHAEPSIPSQGRTGPDYDSEC